MVMRPEAADLDVFAPWSDTGSSSDETWVIVNADDFGMDARVNRGIVGAHSRGVVTSASLMVLREGAAAAAALSRDHPAMSIGLHLDLGEWRLDGDRWVASYEVIPLDDLAAVEREVDRQIDVFQRLMARLPTHMDSHQHVHRSGLVRDVAEDRARVLGIPLRGCDSCVAYEGGFYGQDREGRTRPGWISTPHFVRLLGGLAPGVTEMSCHPGLPGIRSAYGPERAIELETLCHASVLRNLNERGIRLRSFAELPRSGVLS